MVIFRYCVFSFARSLENKKKQKRMIENKKWTAIQNYPIYRQIVSERLNARRADNVKICALAILYCRTAEAEQYKGGERCARWIGGVFKLLFGFSIELHNWCKNTYGLNGEEATAHIVEIAYI